MGHFREVLHNTALTSTEEMKTKHNDSKKAEYSKAILHSRFHSRCHIFYELNQKLQLSDVQLVPPPGEHIVALDSAK